MISELKHIVRKAIEFIREYIWNLKWREKTKGQGGKTFYVIRRGHDNVGLFSYLTVALGHVNHAIELGAIPIIDMQNYPNTYLAIENLHKENAWEYFFEQPMGYKLEDIHKNDTIIYSYGGPLKFTPNSRAFYQKENFEYWRLICRKYIQITEENKLRFAAEFNELFGPDGSKGVLGVLLRGTDYVSTRPLHHPIQPTVEQAIGEIEKMLEKYDLSRIYLQTEDADIFDAMKIRFGEKVISSNSYRCSLSNKQLIGDVLKEKVDIKKNGLEYLRDTYFLMQCDYIIAGLNGGSLAALLMGDYKEYFIFNLGFYGEN